MQGAVLIARRISVLGGGALIYTYFLSMEVFLCFPFTIQAVGTVVTWPFLSRRVLMREPLRNS